MTRGLYNWTFQDVVNFLKDHNFRHNYTEGSHYFYVGHVKGKFRQVHVPFHGSKERLCCINNPKNPYFKPFLSKTPILEYTKKSLFQATF